MLLVSREDIVGDFVWSFSCKVAYTVERGFTIRKNLKISQSDATGVTLNVKRVNQANILHTCSVGLSNPASTICPSLPSVLILSPRRYTSDRQKRALRWHAACPFRGMDTYQV
jgi:hypothetical protein